MAYHSRGGQHNQFYRDGFSDTSFDCRQDTWRHEVNQRQHRGNVRSTPEQFPSVGTREDTRFNSYGSLRSRHSFGQDDYGSGPYDSQLSSNGNSSNKSRRYCDGNMDNCFGSYTGGYFEGSDNMGGNFKQSSMAGPFAKGFGGYPSSNSFIGENLIQSPISPGFVERDTSRRYYASSVNECNHFEPTRNFGKEKMLNNTNRYRQDFPDKRHSELDFSSNASCHSSDGGKKKRKKCDLQQGVKFNDQGERIVEVEIPLQCFSRWGRLRKFFRKQDTEVARHLIEIHDKHCKECLEREEKKRIEKEQRKGENPPPQPEELAEEAALDVLQKTTDEEMEMRRIMGFASFNTTKGAMVEGNPADVITASLIKPKEIKGNVIPTEKRSTEIKESLPESKISAGLYQAATASKKSTEARVDCVSDTSQELCSSTCTDGMECLTKSDLLRGYKCVCQPKPSNISLLSESEPQKGLTEEEKSVMKRLGWSVFNNKAKKNRDGEEDNDDDGSDKDVGDNGKNSDITCVGEVNAAGEWKIPTDLVKKSS